MLIWSTLIGNYEQSLKGRGVLLRVLLNIRNLQNIPSNSTYGKAIKKCFSAPKKWLFCGADFMSLEDRINALLTKDPNKLAVYTSIKSYEIILNGVVHCFDGDSIIEYESQLMTVKEYYETHSVL